MAAKRDAGGPQAQRCLPTGLGAQLSAHLEDDAVAVLHEHDVHELRCEVRGEGARKACEQPLRDVQDARHAVLLQVARQARVVALDEPVEHGHLVLEVAQAVEVEAAQVAAAAAHERTEQLERELLGHVHQQDARHEAHALAVAYLHAVVLCLNPPVMLSTNWRAGRSRHSGVAREPRCQPCCTP